MKSSKEAYNISKNWQNFTQSSIKYTNYRSSNINTHEILSTNKCNSSSRIDLTSILSDFSVKTSDKEIGNLKLGNE